MDLLSELSREQTVLWGSGLLVLMAAGLMTAFPGHNAAHRAYEHPQRVRAISWLLAALLGWSVLQDWNPQVLTPAFLTLWIAVVVWSYGTKVILPVAARAGGFEVRVRLPKPLTASMLVGQEAAGCLELATPAAA